MRIINEQSVFRKRWDIIILLLIFCSIIIVPFQFAFQNTVTYVGSVIIYIIDIFFIIDVLFNYRTSFKRSGVTIIDKIEIEKHYTKTNLAADIIASFPLDAIFLLVPGFELEGISIVLWLRLLRLHRIKKMFDIFQRWKSQLWINPGYIRIGKFISVIIILSHLIACGWYLSAFISGFPLNSWIVLNGLEDYDIITKYIRSLYWTVTTLTTVGYGDITPHLNYEYIVTILVMIMGASMYALIIGNIASLVSNLNAHKSAYFNKIESINLYLQYRYVPKKLKERVINYFDYLWDHHKGLNEQNFFNDLPDPLRLELVTSLAKKLLNKVPLFMYSTPALKNELLLALSAKTYDPQSIIAREGEPGKEIVFITQGNVDIVNISGHKTYCTFESGDYFGDLSLVLGEKRKASAITKDFCEAFILTDTDFFRIKKEYPEFTELLKKISSEKTEKKSLLLLEGIVL